MINNLTHNIIVEFSCSIDTTTGNFKQYHPAVGSTFTDAYNESLDSASIVLNQIQLADRLDKIKPYDYVRVYDLTSWDETTQKYTFDKIYLVDNFTEKETNISVHLFSYTISVMSETKYLEKIQCPSRTITHELDENGKVVKKTIYQYIKEYVDAYVPKVKMYDEGTSTWSYKPILTVPNMIDGINDAGLLSDKNNNKVSLDDNGLKYLSANSLQSTTFNASGSILGTKLTLSFSITNNLTNTILKFPRGWSATVSVLLSSGLTETKRIVLTQNPKIGYNQTISFSSYFVSPRKYSNKSVTSVTILSVSDNYVQINGLAVQYTDFYNKFNVNSADLSFPNPTFRQLLTTLMQQVGCIPVVNRGVIGFLDFNADQPEFNNGDYTVNNTVNNIQRSLSSDSYVNSLINMSSSVLDTNNEVISERLGFRDSGSVILKQQSNLYLETKFPIYKILDAKLLYSCLLRYFVIPPLNVSPLNFNKWYLSSLKLLWDFHGDYINFHVLFVGGKNNQNPVYINSGDLKIHICYGNFVDGFTEKFVAINNDRIEIPDATVQGTETQYHKDYWLYGGEGECDFAWVECKVTNSVGGEYIWCSQCWCRESSEFESGCNIFIDLEEQNARKSFEVTYDFTPFIVENSIRNNLERNYKKMTGSPGDYTTLTDVKEITKFVYGTVGYSIGSTKITGFSEQWSEVGFLGWFNKNYTYIENIVGAIKKIYGKFGTTSTSLATRNKLSAIFAGYPFVQSGETFHGQQVLNPNLIDANFTTAIYDFVNNKVVNSGVSSFVSLLFDIKYQPLNSFALAFNKSSVDIDVPIEQYDSGVGGTVDFDRLSTHEQENVDRVGEETINIGQRTTNFSDIQPLPSYFKDYGFDTGVRNNNDIYCTIFQRQFSIQNNHYDVRYVGSKNAILKNYFTSIRTKYRAYQYVDYSQSVERKERDLIYVRIGENYYNGDDKIWLGKWSGQNSSKYALLDNFICGFNNTSDKKIKYEVDSGDAVVDYHSFKRARMKKNSEVDDTLEDKKITQNQKVKNDISLIANKNSFSIIYSQNDNVSGGVNLLQGIYVKNGSLFQQPQGLATQTGGVPQQWQIWDSSFHKKHNVVFSSYSFKTEINNIYTVDEYEEGRQDNVVDNVATLSKFSMLPVINRVYSSEMEDMFDGATITDTTKFEYDLLDFNTSNDMAITLVDNNNGVDFNKTFNKDGAETLQHTVQFIYYADTPNMKWTEEFIANNGFINRQRYTTTHYVVLGSTDKFELDENEYQDYDTVQTPFSDISSKINIRKNGIGNGECYIEVDWSGSLANVLAFKLVNIDGYTFKDIVAFKRDRVDQAKSYFYVSLNDTKTDYVLDRKNGILYRRAKVDRYTSGNPIRTATKLHNEYGQVTGYEYNGVTHTGTIQYDYGTTSGTITGYDDE